MASSGDELGSYEQSPRVLVSGTSKTNARPVAGPSKPPSKRKKVTASENVELLNSKPDIMDTIAISSDEEDVHATKRGRAAHPVPNGRAVSAGGKGKTTTTAKRKKIVNAEEADAVDDTAAETDTHATTSRRNKGKPVGGNNPGNNLNLLRQQNERLQKQLEDISSQRDDMSTQFDELFQLRHTEAEAQLTEQKMQFEAMLKAKEDTILELQNALTRVDNLSKSSATTTLHFLTRETADEEKRDVQREVSKLKDTLKKKDEIIHVKDSEIHELIETAKVLRADLKTEIDNNKILSSRNPPSATKQSVRSSDGKNALAIRLYEELTNLLVTNVKHEPGKFREDDAIYTCVQTTSTGKSLNFSLRFCKDVEEGDNISSANKNGRTVDKVIYTPLLLEKETEEFVQQLDFLASPFTFQKEQMGVFTKTLLTYLDGENEENQSNTDQMEVEDD